MYNLQETVKRLLENVLEMTEIFTGINALYTWGIISKRKAEKYIKKVAKKYEK